MTPRPRPDPNPDPNPNPNIVSSQSFGPYQAEVLTRLQHNSLGSWKNPSWLCIKHLNLLNRAHTVSCVSVSFFFFSHWSGEWQISGSLLWKTFSLCLRNYLGKLVMCYKERQHSVSFFKFFHSKMGPETINFSQSMYTERWKIWI